MVSTTVTSTDTAFDTTTCTTNTDGTNLRLHSGHTVYDGDQDTIADGTTTTAESTLGTTGTIETVTHRLQHATAFTINTTDTASTTTTTFRHGLVTSD
jgi:hypothetical protein